MPWSTRQTASNDRELPGAKGISSRPAAGSAIRNSACGFASGASYSVTVQGDGPPQPQPDSRMSTFLEFFSAAADFALTLNLKAAIVAASFIVILVSTR